MPTENPKNPKEPQYWDGICNKLIRYYFYVQTGANVFNVFKYVGATIIGVYWVLRLNNHTVLIAMFLFSIPILGIIGYYAINHVNKVMNYLDVKYGSHYSLLNITLLEEIRDLLKDEKNKPRE